MPLPEDVVPRRIEGVTDAVAVVVGDDHGCVLDAAGRVTCWGYCDMACRAGNGPLLFAKPTLLAEVPPLTTMVGDVYGDSACGVGADDERVHCWGVMSASATWFGDPIAPHIYHYLADDSATGRFGRGPNAGALELMTSGVGMSCTRFRDGHTQCFSGGITNGENKPFASLEAPKDPVARMSGSFSQACFVLASGGVECRSTDGILRPPFGKPVRTAAAAGSAVCATAIDGSLLCQRYDWGSGGDRVARLERVAKYEPRVHDVGGPVRAIVSGTHHFCVLRDDDAVYCWDEYGGAAAPERIALPAAE